MRRIAVAVAALIVVVVLALLLLRHLTRDRDLADRITASNAQTVSALALHSLDSAAMDSLIRDSAARDTVIATLAASATASNARAADLRTVIAAMKRPAPTDSTNPEWQQLAIKYDSLAQAETHRADSIGKAFALLGVDRDQWKAQAALQRMAGDTLATALRTSQDLVRDLNLKIQTDASCRFLRFIPCPTRMQTAVGTMLVTAYIATHTDQTRDALNAITSPLTRPFTH